MKSNNFFILFVKKTCAFSLFLVVFFVFASIFEINCYAVNMPDKSSFEIPVFFIPESGKLNASQTVGESAVLGYVQTMKGAAVLVNNGLLVANKDGLNKKIGITFSSKQFADEKTSPVFKDKMNAKINFLVKDQRKCRRGVAGYKAIVYPEVWKNINVEYNSLDSKLEFKVILKPGANPSDIVLQTGLDSLQLLADGKLSGQSDSVLLTIGKPYAFQVIDGVKKEVPVSFKILKNGEFGFELGDYNHDAELIIDPVIEWTEIWGEYGDSNLSVDGLYIDDNNNVYLVGRTSSASFPVTEDSYNQEVKGNYDIFVMKINVVTKELVFSTLIGGSEQETPNNLFVDKDGNVIVVGNTSSSDFPVSEDAVQKSFQGGINDGIIFKLSSNGANLLYSTYFGSANFDSCDYITVDSAGNWYVLGKTSIAENFIGTNAYYSFADNEGNNWGDVFVAKFSNTGELQFLTDIGGNDEDIPKGILVKDNGNIVICGNTDSDNFPATANALFAGGGSTDCFISEFSPSGEKLVYSSMLGGSSLDKVYGFKYDADSNIVLMVNTYSDDFPVEGVSNGIFMIKFSQSNYSPIFVGQITLQCTSRFYIEDFVFDSDNSVWFVGPISEEGCFVSEDAIQASLKGWANAFIVKMNPDLTEITYSTYLGGSYLDYPHFISGNSERICIAGTTYSYDYPNLNPLNNETGRDKEGVFLSVLNKNTKQLEYSTALYVASEEYAFSVDVDSKDNIYVAGYVDSVNSESYFNSYTTGIGGGKDILVAKFSPDGKQLLFSTIIGGSDDDCAYDMDVDDEGNVFLTGYTYSKDFPVRSNALFGPVQSSLKGNSDSFVCKLSSDGTNLLYSTYLGGSGKDVARAIKVDNNGQAFVAGYTYSFDFPVTRQAIQNENKGYEDMFICGINSDASGLVYSTYLGGEDLDYASGLDLDSDGNIYVVGYSESLDFPVTSNAIQGDLNDAIGKVVIVKINYLENNLVFSTYYGGSSDDVGTDIALDSHGDIYVTGYNWSRDFPYTKKFSDNLGATAFVLKIENNTWNVKYCDLLQGNNIYSYAIQVDKDGCAYITGAEDGPSFPSTTESPYEQLIYNVYKNIFVSKIDSTGEVLLSSFNFSLGNSYKDNSFDIALNSANEVIICGAQHDVSFPYGNEKSVTKEVDTFSDLGVNAFVMKLLIPDKMYLPQKEILNENLDVFDAVTGIVNTSDVPGILTFTFYDNAGNIVKVVSKDIPSYGKYLFDPDSYSDIDFSKVSLSANVNYLAYSAVKTVNGKMTAYLDDYSNFVIVPHIADGVDFWESYAFLSNYQSGDYTVKTPIQTFNMQSDTESYYVDLEQFLPEYPVSQNAWAIVDSQCDSCDNPVKGINGFEMFVHNNTDGAAIELQGTGAGRLYIPHIPTENLFWTGFVFVNLSNEDIEIEAEFYKEDGSILGDYTLSIPANGKIVGLIDDLFPGIKGEAEWGIVSVSRSYIGALILGAEIYGTEKDGICGFSLSGVTRRFLQTYTGVFPAMEVGDGLWTGIALTNINYSNAEVKIKLMGANGEVKAEKTETINKWCKFKAVISKEYFGDETLEIEPDDFIVVESNVSLIGVEVCGDLDRTFMTALPVRFKEFSTETP